jgi:N4-gp56 family major capsid protein
MAEIGLTEVGATSQEIVSSLVQETLKQEAIVLPTITDYSSFAIPGSNVVQVPRRTQFAAADKVENVALTAQELTFSVDSINLNKHKAIYASLERIAAVQAMVNVEAEMIVEMSRELALQIDKDIIEQLKLASASAPDHILDYTNSPTDTLQAVDILEARRLLNIQNVPQTDRFLLISPDQEKAMLQISNFIEVDKYGPNEAIANAELGRIYGFRVIMHTYLAPNQAIFYHSSAVGFARQLSPEFKTDDNLSKVAVEYLLHQIYGSTVLDSGKRQVFFNGTGS